MVQGSNVAVSPCNYENDRGKGVLWNIVECFIIYECLQVSITLHHNTSHYIYIASHHIPAHHITSNYITSHYTTSHHITSHHFTSHHITAHYVTLRYIIFNTTRLLNYWVSLLRLPGSASSSEVPRRQLSRWSEMTSSPEQRMPNELSASLQWIQSLHNLC